MIETAREGPPKAPRAQDVLTWGLCRSCWAEPEVPWTRKHDVA